MSTSKRLAVKGATYINEQRRAFSLYTIQNRAIPHIADGLKASSRRVMWTARDGQKWKSANLAGACMPIHPHAAPEDAVNTLAATYGNNLPLLTGIGAFGTRLSPTEYGASRYTSVKVSDFAKDAFYTDIEIIPMKQNYDNTLEEPVHFLPLVPISMLNSSSGIAVGFACDIFPRLLKDIIDCQIKVLEGITPKKEPMVNFQPMKSVALSKGEDDKWLFKGTINRVNTTTIEIVNIPFNVTHEKLTDHLIKLIEDGKMVDYDDASKDGIKIICKFRRDQLMKLEDDDKLLDFFGLIKKSKENINLIDFDGTTVISPNFLETVTLFTNWRLTWYVKRYERLRDLLMIQIQKYQDVLTAIKNDAGGKSKVCKTKSDLVVWLTSIGVVHVDYVAGLPIYRFTIEEKKVIEDKLADAKALLAEYNALIKTPSKRAEKYVEELKVISKKYA